MRISCLLLDLHAVAIAISPHQNKASVDWIPIRLLEGSISRKGVEAKQKQTSGKHTAATEGQ